MLRLFSARRVGTRRPRALGFGQSAAFLLLVALLVAPSVPAAGEDGGGNAVDRASSYYHFALGHLYHQLAQQFMQGEYVERALTEYKAALETDPGAVVVRAEMINLYAVANRLSEAEALAEEMFAEDPENIELRQLMGGIYATYATRRRQAVDENYLAKAVEQFERVAQLEPSEAGHHFELGRLYQMQGKPDLAKESLRRALELDSENAEAEARLAYLLLEAGEFHEGIAALEAVVERGGRNESQYLETLADAYEEIREFREAAEKLDELLARGGDSPQIRQRLAENLIRSRQLDRALEEFRLLLRADPDNPDYLLSVSAIELRRGNLAEARKALDAAREADPDSLQVQGQAINLLVAEDNIDEAVASIESLLDATRKTEYSPGERRRREMLLGQLGALQVELDRPADAVRSFLAVSKLSPAKRPEVLFHIVDTWRSVHDYARAEKEARGAVGEFSDNWPLVRQLASVLADRGKTKEAVRAIQKSVQGASPDMRELFAMADIYVRGRQFAKAVEQVELASEMAGSEQEKVDVLFNYGSVLERSKQYDQAEAKFRELLRIDPDNANALNYLGYMFADRDTHLDEAHGLIAKALEIEPDNGAYLDSLGWVYYRQGKFDLAVEYLERSLEQIGDDTEVHSHLGDAYYKLGRIADAERHWKLSLEAWNSTPPAGRDTTVIQSLRRKLADLEVSVSESKPAAGKKANVRRFRD